MKKFYLDTCIWLNLFKKEGNETKGKPYWEIAKEFIENIIFSKEKEIFYSGFVLKELMFILEEEKFKEKIHFLRSDEKFIFVKAINEDYLLARKIESESGYRISFYDCLHIAVCKRLNFVLVTRDQELINFAKKYISAEKPESLMS